MQKSFWSLSLGCTLLSPAIVIPAAQAVSLKVLPTVQTVNIGESFDIDIEVSDLGDLRSPSLSGFDLNLSFDNTILIFNSFSFGDPVNGDLVGLTPDTRIIDIQTSFGLVSFAEVSLDDTADLNNVQPATFILGRANFRAVRAGTSQLALGVGANGLLDENTSLLLLTEDPTNSSVIVTGTQVTEPNLSWLGLGLTIGLGATVTSKKRKFLDV
jgi:hypothetical protein